MVFFKQVYNLVANQCSHETEESQIISIPRHNKRAMNFIVRFEDKDVGNVEDDKIPRDVYVRHACPFALPEITAVINEFETKEIYKDLALKVWHCIEDVRTCPCCGIEKWFRAEAEMCHKCAYTTFLNEENTEECAVCREVLGVYYKSPYDCTHAFHIICSNSWQGGCPLCRNPKTF